MHLLPNTVASVHILSSHLAASPYALAAFRCGSGAFAILALASCAANASRPRCKRDLTAGTVLPVI
jgi:hypothetical protein